MPISSKICSMVFRSAMILSVNHAKNTGTNRSRTNVFRVPPSPRPTTASGASRTAGCRPQDIAVPRSIGIADTETENTRSDTPTTSGCRGDRDRSPPPPTPSVSRFACVHPFFRVVNPGRTHRCRTPGPDRCSTGTALVATRPADRCVGRRPVPVLKLIRHRRTTVLDIRVQSSYSV